MKGLKCIAPIFDVSGYAEWARSYILTLIKHGVPITIGTDLVRKTGQPITFEANRPNLGEDGNLLQSYIGKPIEYDTVISWLTPEFAYEQMSWEVGVKKVNMTLWETDELPAVWHQFLIHADEIWVPGKWNSNIFRQSINKVVRNNPAFSKLSNIPIKDIPFPIKPERYALNSQVTPSNGIFSFYYISQWNKRKNFEDLLEAYVHEFSADDNVLLVLKTYLANDSEKDKKTLQDHITRMVAGFCKPNPPKVALIHGSLSSQQMLELHAKGDCYVSPSRGEGLGLGMVEAAMFNKPIICNSFGEHSSFLNDNTAFIYKHRLRPVTGMGGMGSLYTINQHWADPDVLELGKTMRLVYEKRNTSLGLIKATKAKQKMLELYNENKVVETILKAAQ